MKMILVSLAGAIAGAVLLAAPVRADDFYKEAKPLFENCADGSYDRAVKDGITIGVSNVSPHSFVDPKTNEPAGVDVEINQAAADWLGIKTVKFEWLPWESQIPSLLSKRTDVVGTNIHINPERVKVITFSGPAWWYGPVLLVQKGNPDGIKSYDDVKDKDVGAVAGSAAEAYLRNHGSKTVLFEAQNEELQSLNQGRIKYALEDDVVFSDFARTAPDNKIDALSSIPVPTEITYGGGYGYARYAFRPDDCQLRVAYTQALAELRGNGHVSAILKKYGLSDRNLVWYSLQP